MLRLYKQPDTICTARLGLWQLARLLASKWAIALHRLRKGMLGQPHHAFRLNLIMYKYMFQELITDA